MDDFWVCFFCEVKKRRKLGKKLEKSSATKTSFKAKRIRVHDQNVGPLNAEDTYEIEELLELLLSKTSTGREKVQFQMSAIC